MPGAPIYAGRSDFQTFKDMTKDTNETKKESLTGTPEVFSFMMQKIFYISFSTMLLLVCIQ